MNPFNERDERDAEVAYLEALWLVKSPDVAPQLIRNDTALSRAIEDMKRKREAKRNA